MKRGLSTIVSTVLIILITVVAIGIISAVIIPWVKDNLTQGNCFKSIDKLVIDEEAGYTCFNLSSNEVQLTIKLKADIQDLEGFAVSIEGNGTSKRFDVNSKIGGFSDIKMYQGNYNSVLGVPNPGEERTYVFKLTFNAEKAEVAPMLQNNHLCDVTDSAELPPCS